jgi:Predicted membrane protein (DUF2339)
LQITGLCLDGSGRTGEVLLLAIVFWLLFLGTGVAEALTRGKLTRFAAAYVVGGSAFSGYAAAALLGGDDLGWALLVSAAVDTVLAALVFRRDRNLVSLCWAAALALGAVGTAQLISGATLTMAWSAEAAVLAWLAIRLREPRFQFAALAWIGLALLHVLAFDSPLSRLFERNDHPAAGVPSLLALVAASALVGWFAERKEIRLAVFGLGALLAVDAASLCMLAVSASWDWGHVGVISLWGAVAIALTPTPCVSRARRGRRRPRRSRFATTSSRSTAVHAGRRLRSQAQPCSWPGCCSSATWAPSRPRAPRPAPASCLRPRSESQTAT